MSIEPNAGQASGCVACASEPVHHRVAPIGHHDQQHADLVVGRAPQRLDGVHRRSRPRPRPPPAGRDRPSAGRSSRPRRSPALRCRRPRSRPGGGRHASVELGLAGGRLLDDDRVAGQPLGQCRQHVSGGERLAGGRRWRRRRGRCSGAGGSVSRWVSCSTRAVQAAGTGATTASSQGLRWASARSSVRTATRVPSGDHRTGIVEQVEPEGVGADGQHQVVRAQDVAHLAPAPGQVPGEQRMVLRKAGSARERLLPHRAAQPLGERDHPLPALAAVGAVAHHQGGGAGALDHLGQLADLGRRDRGGAHGALGPPGRVIVGGLVPVAHRHHHQRRTALRLGLVVGARDGPGHVLGADREARPHRVLAGQPLQRAAGQKRLVRQLAAVLLADQNDQRGAAVAGVGDGVDGIAQTGGGVQVDERRLAAGQRVAGGDSRPPIPRANRARSGCRTGAR